MPQAVFRSFSPYRGMGRGLRGVPPKGLAREVLMHFFTVGNSKPKSLKLIMLIP